MNGDISRLVGCLFGRDAQFEEAGFAVLRLVRRVFKVQAFVRQVPHVFIFGIVGLAVDFQRNVMRFGIFDFLFTGFDIPLPPGGDDFHFRRKRFERQLETHLVVALAGAAVANRVGALFFSDFRQAFGDAGTRVGSAEQIGFIVRARFQARPNVIFHIFLFEVQNIQLGSAGFQSLFFEPVKLGALTDVAGNGNHFAVVVIFFQPRNNNRSIEAAGIGKNHFFNIFFHNEEPPGFVFFVLL